MVTLKDFMRNKISSLSIIYSLVFLLTFFSYSMAEREGGILEMKEKEHNQDILIKVKFLDLYNQWQVFIHRKEVQLSSKSFDYINCEPYQNIIKLGKSVLPYIMEKIKEGKNSQWKEGQFFLWYAIKEISGVDLHKSDGMLSEQAIAERYLDWWEKEGDRASSSF